MSDVIIITLGFVPAKILEQSMAALYATRNTDLPITHYLLDQHYPLNQEKNRKAIAKICAKHGIHHLDAGKNLGLAKGFNYCLKMIGPKPGSTIIAYDPDVKPTTPGWDMALVRAIRGDPKRLVVWSSLMHDGVRDQIASVTADTRKADGYLNMRIINRPIMNSISAFDSEWLKSVGGLAEPTNFYGGLEAEMWGKLKGKQWAFLTDWEESCELRDQHDDSYTAYKYLHANTREWPGDFASWLDAGKPGRDKVPKEYFKK